MSVELGKRRRPYHLPMIVIYDKPKDYPEDYVARLWWVGPIVNKPSSFMVRAASLEEIRQAVPPGLMCFGRDVNDDPCIVEVWI